MDEVLRQYDLLIGDKFVEALEELTGKKVDGETRKKLFGRE